MRAYERDGNKNRVIFPNFPRYEIILILIENQIERDRYLSRYILTNRSTAFLLIN